MFGRGLSLAKNRWNRLSSIESQPKKVVVVVISVGHKDLTLKFGQNWVNIMSDILQLLFSLF